MQKNFDIKIGDLKINISHKYDFLPRFCERYIVDNNDAVELYAKTTDAQIQSEHTAVPSSPIEVCESLCVYRSIAEQLPEFNRFVFHGAVIKYDGKAIMFTAPSGTGKTTHISLWKKYLGDSVEVINGDKPIISVNETVTAYGTPWCGKEGLNNNTSAPLKSICIIRQAKVNAIKPLDKKEAIRHLMRQVYLPKQAAAAEKTLELLGALIETIPVYILECDISEQAFKTSFNTIR